MKQTDKEMEEIFGKKTSSIDKKSMSNRMDSEFRKSMIGFIKGFGLKKRNGEYHRFYEHVDFSGHSDDQVSKLYMEIRKRVVQTIMNGRKKHQPSAYYLALWNANEIVKDNAISILLESK